MKRAYKKYFIHKIHNERVTSNTVNNFNFFEMKKYIYILLALFAMSVFSCDDPLDSTDLNVITSDVVWGDENLIDAYYSDLYDQSEWWRHIDKYKFSNQVRYALWSMSAEGEHRGGAAQNSGNGAAQSLVSAENTTHSLQIWTKFDGNTTAWELLRAINEAIFQLENTVSITNNYREYRLGEAHYMRAHLYFRLVKLYGGVPIIKEVQDVNAGFESLQVPRSTEEETYDFIAEEFDTAISYLEDKDNSDLSRITVWAAWAMKSRAMLYAGSIAENNDLLPMPDPNGLVGINPSQASRFYQASLEASQQLLPAPYGNGTAPFSLMPGSTVEEYRVIFDEPDNSSECIMIQHFDGILNKANDSEVLLLPRVSQPHPNQGCVVNTYWEVVQWFDYKDGISGTRLPDDSGDLDAILDDGNFYDFDALFAYKDPRFRSSIGLPGMMSKGEFCWFHDKTANGTSNPDIPNQGAKQNHIQSGICIYKNANNSTPVTLTNQGDNPLNHLRLSEIYLNYSEASLALGTGAGLEALNEIRGRAGMPLYTEFNIDNLREERKLELFAENHRYYDLKRWRMAQTVLTPAEKHTYVNFTIDANNRTYQLKSKPERYIRLFEPEDYYLPIPLMEILNNDILVQNPGF